MRLGLAALRGDYEKAGAIDRAVVAKRVPVLAGLGIVAGELVRDGVIPDGLANGITHWATVAFTALGVLGGVLWAQRGTTPADPQLLPKDKYGNDLVSALSVGPHAGLSDDDPAPVAALSGPTAADALAAAAAINPQPTLADPFMEGGRPPAATEAAVNPALTAEQQLGPEPGDGTP